MRCLRYLPLLAAFSLGIACRDSAVTPADSGNPPIVPDGGIAPDGGPDTGVPPDPDGGVVEPPDGGHVVTGCENPPLTAPANGTCSVTDGNDNILIQGNVLVPSGVLENGSVLVGANGRILCAACDCADAPEANGATTISCANGLISPALINAHDHITFTEAPPAPHTAKYDHRHQWRRGQDGLPRIPSVSNEGGDRGVWWGEIRNIMAGATTINGSGGANGLARNIDRADQQEGLGNAAVRYETFPLADTNGGRLASGCGYPDIDDPNSAAIANSSAYTPHISEGIDDTARNEYLCLSQEAMGGHDVVFNKTAIIHGIGLNATDFRDMAASRAKLIWSPRSNIDLYGNTAQIVLARNSGVRIALGSDWAISGSMNIQRELVCADEFNARNMGGAFSDREIVDMATVNAASALGAEEKLGSLAPGLFADITIWNAATNKAERAILDAQPKDVVLVLRGGSALYGDQTVMTSLPNAGGADCEMIDVCGTQKSLCAQRETGSTTAQMKTAIAANAYPLFFCGAPDNEPTCIPFRTDYTGMPMNGDMDGDGVMDAVDNCPSIFNPARPMDDGMQANVDGDDDGGDACDPCPTLADTTNCARPDPLDIDGDTILDAMDNCRLEPNTDQADRDMDMIGDVCDACPDVANVGSEGCPATVYQVKRAEVSGAVKLNNMLVTAVARNGLFAQTVEGDADYDMTLRADYSGIFVFTSAAPAVAAGDRVDISGLASEFFGQRQLDITNGGSITVLSSNNALPEPIVVAPADVATNLDGVDGVRAEALEAVLVEVRMVTVTNIMPPQDPGDSTARNEFLVDDVLRVDDYMYTSMPFPTVGEELAYVRGVMRYAFNNYRLEPRSSLDIGSEERLVGFEPALAYAVSNSNGVPLGGFQVRINRPATAPITVSLSSSSPNTVVPASVTIPANAVGADVPLTIAANESGRVNITATYNMVTVMGAVFVYDDAAPRAIDGFEIIPARIPLGQTGAGTVTLNLPGALASGTVVALNVSRPGIISAPANVNVAPGQTTATFTVTTVATGTVSIEANVGSSSEFADLEVYVPTSRTPGPGDLVITEIFRNPSGADEKFREWFEVHNVSGVEIIVDGLTVGDNQGSVTINAGGETIAPGAYAVIAYSDDPAINGGVDAIAAYGGQSTDIQLANGSDSVTISFGGMDVDEINWAAMWPGAGQGVSGCLKVPYAMNNNDPAAWSNSVGGFGTVASEQGSPGLASTATNCP